jgi:hypothetical protein
MNREVKHSIFSFLVEIVVYAGLVAAYYSLVLHFLGDWLNHLFHRDRRAYAALALGLIIGQGILLEILTRFLLAFVKPRTNLE